MSRTHDVSIQAFMFDLDRLERELATVTEQRDRLAEEIENLKASGIHSCHDQCKRPMCAMRRQRDRLAEVAQAVWDRWETPLWKDHPPTALVMNKLRDALEAVKGGSDE